MMAPKMKQVVLKLRIICVQNSLLSLAIGEVVKKTFQKMVDAKLLQRVKLSTRETETDNVTLSKYQLPPTEGIGVSAKFILHVVCKCTTGIRYKCKRSIDPSEIVEEPSAKKHKGFGVAFVYN